MVLRRRKLYAHIWPIDQEAARLPDGWVGWPDKKKFALVLTHDVDTERGLKRCIQLARIEETLGFRSSFNFVAERYIVPPELRQYLTHNGFEVGVHGLYHDGKLYKSKEIFQSRAVRINHYLEEWGSVGFRSPSMQHNLEWIHDLKIKYDASTFDTDPFEPQPDGMGTIFPFWVDGDSNQKGYVELPYTLAQDFTLFVIMQEKNINIWKRKLDWIIEKGGMALLNSHPDYMSFEGKKPTIEEYPVEYYMEFLGYIKHNYRDQYWHVLPKEIAHFWGRNFQTKERRNTFDGNCKNS
jgi:hypothetical protein